MTRAGLPNVGFSFNFNTGRNSGLKNFTVGFSINRSNSWCEDMYARGTNNQTSFLGAMAYDATCEIADLNKNNPAEPPFTSADYMSDDAYKYMNWQNTVGYRSGMISTCDPDKKEFVGATELVQEGNQITLAGDVAQEYGRAVSGNKYEYVLNMGANISDFLYIGLNLGMHTLNYDYTHYFRESAVDPFLFENEFLNPDDENQTTIVHFRNAKYTHNYSADGNGVFGKLGFILTPGNGLRFGAAVQTPTAMTIKEQWQDSGYTEFDNSNFNGSAASDTGSSEYSFSSPWRANFGAAYVLGKFAVFSVDYEVAGFGGMKYEVDRHTMSEADCDYFEDVNNDISQAYGNAHYLRVGAEIKPASCLALRAGYNLSTAAQKKYYDAEKDDYLALNQMYGHNLSFGAGFNSKNSFFADIACRYTFASNEYITPYSDYLWESDGALPPEILNRHSNWQVLLTLGWRF